MRISDWSSDVCSSDLKAARSTFPPPASARGLAVLVLLLRLLIGDSRVFLAIGRAGDDHLAAEAETGILRIAERQVAQALRPPEDRGAGRQSDYRPFPSARQLESASGRERVGQYGYRR